MNVFDKDGSGFLDREVLEASLRNLGDGLTKNETEELLASIRLVVVKTLSSNLIFALDETNECNPYLTLCEVALAQ